MDKSNFIVGIQARSTSARFPGKCSQVIYGTEMWRSVFWECRSTGIDCRMLVPENDKLVSELETCCKEYIIIGPESSPLQRFQNMLAASTAKNIIRITADCPLIGSWMILDMAHLFERDNRTFMYNEIDGMDVQIANRSIFDFPGYLDDEHVFNMDKIKEHGLYTKWEMHLSVDTKEQYEHIKFITGG